MKKANIRKNKALLHEIEVKYPKPAEPECQLKPKKTVTLNDKGNKAKALQEPTRVSSRNKVLRPRYVSIKIFVY